AEQASVSPRLPPPGVVAADALPDSLPSSLASIATIEQQVAPPAPALQTPFAPSATTITPSTIRTPTITAPTPAPSTVTSSMPAPSVHAPASPGRFANTPAPSSAHTTPAATHTTTAPVTAQPAAQPVARQIARLTAQPAHVVQAQPASPALAHAPQQSLASDANAKAANSNGAPPNIATILRPSVATDSSVAANSASPVAPAVRAAPAAPRLTTPRLTSPLGPVPSVLSPAPSPLARINDNAPTLPAPLAKVATPAPTLVGRDPHKFSALPVPRNWLGVSSTLGGEYKFSLRAADGRQSGVAVWSRVNLPAQAVTDKRNRALAGVAHASLRRTVIDRMILEGGWVVNDFEREVAGRKVFVVVAQSESNGQRRAWTYYFVELDGQLYSLATTAPTEFADSVSAEAEQTLSALAARHGAQNTSQAGRSN
ncbi:MAG: hypothetical protein M3268_08650, partial [Acidobacteriota bacterium]|nr:hypothetical protein [Acidobacteriota bacterium]